jgi:molecular chaperone GrpE
VKGMSEEGTKRNIDSQKAKKPSNQKKPNKYLAETKKLKKVKEELQDQLLRKIAEFDNYKKRTERDFYNRVQNANEKLILDLLPVLDDFDRSFEHAKQIKDNNVLLEGTDLIRKKLVGILQKQGLESLPSVGVDFDPDKHDALMQIESKDYDTGKIVEEHLKGYTLNEKVIRHSQVIVAK